MNNNEPKLIVKKNGTKLWWLNGELHREDGPAIERMDGSKEWYLNGSLHRIGGPAIKASNGGKEWWVNGFFHREGGPAIEMFGHKWWFLNGKEYSTKEEWFSELTPEQQYNYLWSLDEI
jgi:hypothetical protein